MVTLVNNLEPAKNGSPAGYDAPVKIDTTIPPKPKPMMHSVAVNGEVIPEAEILEEAQHHPAKNPGEALKAAARALVVKRLLAQKAIELDISSQPETDAEGRIETAEDASIRALMEQEITVPQATDVDCRRYYDHNTQRFSSDTIYQARHILLVAAPQDPVARKKAQSQAASIIDRLLEEPDRFDQLAAELSACPSAKQGGNLGQITTGDTVAEFEAALETMQDGDLFPQPVETPYGFHVIFLDRKIDGQCLPFDQVSERISTWLQAASWSRAVSQYISILAGQAEIEGVDMAFSDSPLVQ